jgi:hypothetical protein
MTKHSGKKAKQSKSRKTSSLDDALNQISDESVAAASKEFQDLLSQAKGDTTAFVQENAKKLEERLDLVRTGKLDQEDFDFFVENQKRALQIFIDSQPPQAQERAEKLTINLLELAAKKLVPVLIAMI